jgi:site-specific DNA-methyltransferase (adenine-specific)
MDFEKVVVGDCVLYRGDSHELLAAGYLDKIGAIVSDPPYGIGYQHSGGTKESNALVKESRTDVIYGDDKPFDPTPWINHAPNKRSARRGEGITEEKLILLFGADHFRVRLPAFGTLLAWDKHLGKAGDDSFADCEWAWVGRKCKREVFRYLWKGILMQKSGIEHRPARAHVSEKPIELMRWCIDKVRPASNLPVLDPFMGSGSTAIACLTLGIPFVGVEYEQRHFDHAVDRIRKFLDGRLFV